MNRPLVSVLALTAAAIVAAAGAHPALAAAKPAATPAPSPSPSASAAAETLDKAIPRLEAHLKTDPTDKAAQQELATDYLEVNRPDLALGLSQRLLAGGTKTAQTYYIDGMAQEGTGHNKEALADLEQAANLEPTNPGVLGTLTNMYLRQNRPQDAERVAKRAVTFNPADENSLLAYGGVLAAEGKYDDARVQYDAAAKLAPKDARPLMLEAQTYMQSNSIALASQLFDRAVAIDPKNVDALIGKAHVQAAQHNVPEAMATYDQILALQTDPVDKVAVLDQEASVYATEKMDAQADATYRKAIADYPNVFSAHTAYGDYLISKNDKAGAEREWIAGAGPNRDQPDALLRLGQYYASINQLPKATDQFKQLAQVAPNDPRSHLYLGAAYLANHQYDKARDEYKTSYNLQHTPDALLGLAQADFQTHQYTECATVYKALDDGAPALSRQNPSILFGLGQCYQHTNQNDKAKGAYQKLLGYLPPNSQGANQVKALIAQIDRGAHKPAPQKSPSAKK